MPLLKYAVDSPHLRGWVERVGRIIMNFSAVEQEAVLWLVQLTHRHEDTGGFNAQTFNTKAKEIERCIAARSVDKVWRKKALRCWNEARDLASIRNQVAHSPILFGWNDPAERGEPDFVSFAAVPKAGRRKRKDMLGRHEADKAGNAIAALCERLAALREEWCALRDQGLVPPADEPKKFWHRVRARIHRWIDKISMAIEATREPGA